MSTPLLDPHRLRSEIMDLAFASPRANDFEDQILALLDREIGMEVAFFAAGNRAASTREIDRFVVVEALSNKLYARETLPIKRAALARRGVAVDTEVLGLAGAHDAAYFRHLAKPLRGKHSLVGYLVLRGRVLAWFMLGRCGSSFKPSEIQLVEDLIAPLTLARASFGLPRGADLDSLTERERDVLDYLRLGYTNREIATACATSPNTVRNQLVSIFAKLGATTRAEAVALASG